MLSRSVGIAATCALGASAFLVPAGIASTSDFSTSTIVNPKEQLLTLPCSECAFGSKQETATDADDEGLFWIQGGANSLVLNFTISEDGHALQLNGREIHPGGFVPEDMSIAQQHIYVKQVPSETGLVDIESGSAQSTDLEVTAYGVEEVEAEQMALVDDNTLLSVMLNIMELENERVHLDEVAVQLLKTDGGELLIIDVKSVPNDRPEFERPADLDFPPPPPQHHGPPHHHEPAECDVLPAALCKLKAMIDSKIGQAMRHGGNSPKKGGCRGRKGPPGKHLPSHIKPHLVRPDQDGGPNFHHGRPHHMRPHGPHHDHHGPHRHSFWHGFMNGLVAVLVPIMAGVAVGMTVSLLGLVVGRTIGFLWIKLARGGRRGSASNLTVIEDGENDGMLAKMEPPPVYEDAPAYAQNEKEQV